MKILSAYKIIVSVFVSWLLITMSNFVYAQKSSNSFAEILVKANKEYEAGNLDEAVALATSCSIEHASESDQWKAYRLLAMIYLANNQTDLAREAAENMLTLNPTYKPNYLKDPADLVKLLSGITVIPKFSLGLAVSAGTNTTFPDITKGYLVSDYKKTYTAENGFQFGLSTGYTINKHVAIEAGILATRKAYSISYQLPDWQIDIQEKLTYLDVPVMLKYIVFPDKRFHLTFQGGGYLGYLLYSNNNFKGTFSPSVQTQELTDLNSIARRNRLNYGLILGIGGTYKLGEGDVFLQINYFKSYANITNSSTRYTYNELLYNYFYIDDDIILNNMAITVGYAFYLNYKVVKQ